MATVDQRILIPSPPDVVWDYISDLNRNPSWQADCTTMTFLTSRRSGPTTRWRATSGRGSDYVVEVTAWYEGLGYEYTFIDGVPFRDSKGRIRLREIAEGTIVQWTVSYEMVGILGGMRDVLSISRQMDANLVTSLKNLWREIRQISDNKAEHQPKSLMRDAPDAEQRSKYRPRHLPVVDVKTSGKSSTTTPAIPASPVAEPPVADDDTRPNHPVSAPPPRPAPALRNLTEQTDEPDFLDDLSRFAPPPQPPAEAGEESTLVDTQPLKPVRVDDQITQPSPTVDAGFTETEPLLPVVEEQPPLPPATPWLPPVEESRHTENGEVRLASLPEPQEDFSKLDTATVSIWEVFGVPRPSESQEMRAVTVEPDAADVEEPPPPEPAPVVQAAVEVTPPTAAIPRGRVGLRLRQRRDKIRLRWPG